MVVSGLTAVYGAGGETLAHSVQSPSAARSQSIPARRFGTGSSTASESPPDFASRFGAVDGNAFAIEPTLHQSAYFRAPNRVPGVRGLYHVGGGTHPGAGIPGVLMGAAVTAGLVTADAGVRV